MNKKALKEFAIYARNELRSQIALRAQAFGVTPKGSPVLVTGADYVEINNKNYPLTYKKGLQKLIKEIESKGYDNVIEEVAYTWFNRLIAIRFMEVHNYLPSRVRVLSSVTKGKVDPDVLTEYQYTELPVNKDEIASFLGQGNREEAFRKLLIAQCNELSEIMPFLFEKIEDFTEMLLPESLLHADSLINKLGKELDDENFQRVEVIGWLYQYYISEKKDEVFAGLKKNIKITKENIPAATQLFTPHWIVRYMVENSLGHMWLESHPESNLKKELKYYVVNADQDPVVQAKLEELRDTNLSPEEITIIDPACGSGHMLVYAFDLLYKIYEERGYPSKDIPFLILEKNLYGIDIDDRAVQLASFALMMKAREKTKKVFRFIPKLNTISIQETNDIFIYQAAKLIGETENEVEEIDNLLRIFIDAKNLGSILQPPKVYFDKYIKKINSIKENLQITFENYEVIGQLERIKCIFIQAKILTNQYDVVITNPPYLGYKGMNPQLSQYAKKYYSNSKSDLFSIFMERGILFTKENGYHGEINQQTWMFLGSYETLRKKLFSIISFQSMLHLGPRTFEEIGGEVVQSTAFIFRKNTNRNQNGIFYRLIDYNQPELKEKAFLNRNSNDIYIRKSNDFSKIPGFIIAYWVPTVVETLFEENSNIGDLAEVKSGLSTGDNTRFLRLWHEVEGTKLALNCYSAEDTFLPNNKWVPYNKGGGYRKWYGNHEYVVNWLNDGEEIKLWVVSNPKDPGTTHWSRRIYNTEYSFREGLTWSKVSTSDFSLRYLPKGFISDVAGCTIFTKGYQLNKFLALLNSKVGIYFLNIMSQTLNYEVSHVKSVPVVKIDDSISNIVEICKEISKNDWDSFETSWNFKNHPFLVFLENKKTLDECYNKWEKYLEKQFQQMKNCEEELNKTLIDLYSLKGELTPNIQNEDVKVRLANRSRDSRSFLSYCIGLMMGRYSLDVEGLAFTGGELDTSKFQTFKPDSDGIIPLTDKEYFEDDIVSRLQELLVILFGQNVLAENLRWLAESLTMKENETPVERLRRYYFDEFYADHCKIYQKRPIYWLVESGSKKGFRALFYLHRYTPETLATMRFTYVQNLQEKLRQEQKRLEQDLLNPDISATMKKRYQKQLATIKAQQDELIDFDKKLAELANQRIALDLDDGVVVNYAKLQNILARIK